MSLETFNPQNGQGLDDDEVGASSPGQFGSMGNGAGATKRRKISDTTIVLMGTVILGAGILLGMRWLGTRASMFSVDATVEKTVNEFLTKLTSDGQGTTVTARTLDSDSVMTNLNVDRTQAQVPLNQVKRNPFISLIRRARVASPDDPGDMIDVQALKAEQMRLARQQEWAREVESMRLSSIMGKEGNRVAVLENLVVQEGDILDDVFLVKKINPFDIIIEVDGLEFRKSLTK